jgi:LPXTG-motif cell wall-anchored protein
VGTTVRITNTGPSTHTWSSDPGSPQQWDSGPIGPGASFSVTFDRAGSFGFHCNIHPFMTGTIVVAAATPPTTAPPTTTTAAGTGAPGTPRPASASTAPAAVGPPTTAVGERATALPRTGSSTGPLVAVAATALLLGAALAGSGSRRRVARR